MSCWSAGIVANRDATGSPVRFQTFELDRFGPGDAPWTSKRYARSVPETYVTAYVTGHGDNPLRVWGVGPGCSSRKGEHVLLTAHENMSR